MTESQPARRSIRSFVRRTGRITPAQDRARKELWPQYGLDYTEETLDLDAVFGRAADKVLEIGFGNGESLVLAAADDPHTDFLGIEVHEPGVGHCMIHANKAAIKNLRIIAHDAIEVLQQQIADSTFSRVNLYFPDPWPKKRHHKRRIIQHDFLQLVAQKLIAGGTLHIATDWQNYAEHIDEVVADSAIFDLEERRVHAGDQPLQRHGTKFEARGLRKGHRIWDWRFRRN
jgi:tRNA (guanine-N7-)-methyltransferase